MGDIEMGVGGRYSVALVGPIYSEDVVEIEGIY
jgi:hypothetical protein